MPHDWTTTRLLATSGMVLILATTAAAQRPKPKETMIQGHTMYTLLKPGDIPAIFEPEFLPVADADSLYYDDEPLLAVASGDDAKAYSIWHLDHHEVVNDHIGGTAIASTW